MDFLELVGNLSCLLYLLASFLSFSNLLAHLDHVWKFKEMKRASRSLAKTGLILTARGRRI